MAALRKINDVRNNIVGRHEFVWTEHFHGLVDALEEVGLKGMTYGDANRKVLSMARQNQALEAHVKSLQARIKELEKPVLQRVAELKEG
jgi:hypothetical protein